jgi:NAD+ kinase
MAAGNCRSRKENQVTRLVLLLTNAEQPEAAAEVAQACELLRNRGITAVLPSEDFERITRLGVDAKADALIRSADQEFEAALVLGGDGSILRAAEEIRGQGVPILGVNLGHVGFMAEAEREGLEAAIDALASGNYQVRERMTLEILVTHEGVERYRGWAVNEVALEKSAERMLEVAIEVDSRPITSFGCDGVLVATPTGSTAYAFSAGGPIIWPNVEALLVVPLSAHALFSRPLVVADDSVAAIEVLRRSPGAGVLWCDGRRTFKLDPGSRIEVRRSDTTVAMILLGDAPFADRLVRKFALPVEGWRGAAAKRSDSQAGES